MDVGIPSYVDLMWPTLVALERIGGPGKRSEIEEKIIALSHLTEAQLLVKFPPEASQSGSKIVHRMTWARTYLKKIGAIENTTRGLWSLTDLGREILQQGEQAGRAQLHDLNQVVRRNSRLGISDHPRYRL